MTITFVSYEYIFAVTKRPLLYERASHISPKNAALFVENINKNFKCCLKRKFKTNAIF